jgi:hypothetical protein
MAMANRRCGPIGLSREGSVLERSVAEGASIKGGKEMGRCMGQAEREPPGRG